MMNDMPPFRLDIRELLPSAPSPEQAGESVVPKADIASGGRHVRFTPKSGHAFSAPRCPLCAKSGHCRGLIDYFISAAKKRRRHGETKHSGGLRIDHQLEFGRFNNWQLCRLRTLKDAANIATGLTI